MEWLNTIVFFLELILNELCSMNRREDFLMKILCNCLIGTVTVCHFWDIWDSKIKVN